MRFAAFVVGHAAAVAGKGDDVRQLWRRRPSMLSRMSFSSLSWFSLRFHATGMVPAPETMAGTSPYLAQVGQSFSSTRSMPLSPISAA